MALGTNQLKALPLAGFPFYAASSNAGRADLVTNSQPDSSYNSVNWELQQYTGYGTQTTFTNYTVTPTLTPGTTTYCAGFLDGELRSKLFYTDGSSIALPTISTISYIEYWNGAFGVGTPAYEVGWFTLTVKYATGSPDAASPAVFRLDQNAILIVTTTSYPYGG